MATTRHRDASWAPIGTKGWKATHRHHTLGCLGASRQIVPEPEVYGSSNGDLALVGALPFPLAVMVTSALFHAGMLAHMPVASAFSEL